MFESYHSDCSNYMINIFHISLNCFLLMSAILVFLSENSVHSILFLVLTFINASAICFLFGADFLGLILIIIYVGAIAVLFLFVVMMLNVKVQLLGIIKFMPLIIVFSIIMLSQIFLITSTFLVNFDFFQFSFTIFDSLTNDYFLSQALYNYFLLCFLLSGIILLVGMIGAIVLTLNFNTKKRTEIAFRQLSRSDEILFLFK